jgi:hypothetical protein
MYTRGAARDNNCFFSLNKQGTSVGTVSRFGNSPLYQPACLVGNCVAVGLAPNDLPKTGGNQRLGLIQKDLCTSLGLFWCSKNVNYSQQMLKVKGRHFQVPLY